MNWEKAIRAALALLLVCAPLFVGSPVFAEAEAYVILQDSPLAGFQFHNGKALWGQLGKGDRLTLTREPDNRYDANAIRVDWRGHKLGYVPRRENADIARLMDNGAKLEARITRLTESRDPWQRVRFEVVLPLDR